MRTPIARVLFSLALTIAWLAPTAPVLAQASVGDNALSYTDQDFISQLYQEIIASQRLAGLAVNQGQKSSVRSLGGSVTESLRQVRETIRLLAKKKGVTISDDLIAQNQDAVDKLSSASGDDFDRTYIDILMQYLPRILSRCESVASTTQDADLKALTSNLVPTLTSRIAAVQAVKSDL
jgi:predicted outer membrane protein